jgi:hypothetical protein
MPLALRSRAFALATLAVFILAQPAAWCTALCLFEGHHGGVHATHGTDRGTSALDGSACHTGTTGGVERGPGQLLSPMVPAGEPVIPLAPAGWLDPDRPLPASPHLISPTVEPPPPRLV